MNRQNCYYFWLLVFFSANSYSVSQKEKFGGAHTVAVMNFLYMYRTECESTTRNVLITHRERNDTTNYEKVGWEIEHDMGGITFRNVRRSFESMGV
jgi:hypothetical protein